jgi:uncharacterized membrane protein YccC
MASRQQPFDMALASLANAGVKNAKLAKENRRLRKALRDIVDAANHRSADHEQAWVDVAEAMYDIANDALRD